LRTFGIAGADEERLTIRAGDQVSRAGRETYGFEYRLTDRWSLAGEYDEFDAYNMGVRRRFQAKVPEAEEPAAAQSPEEEPRAETNDNATEEKP
jgi:translocation and assembly module TamB